MKKRILFSMLLFIGITFSTQAQDEAFKEDAYKLTKLSSGIVEANLGQVYMMIPEDNIDDFKKELQPILDDFYKKLAEKCMEYYTHDEVKTLLKFYNSEIGKKSLEVQKKMTQETMAMSQEINMKLMPLIQKYTE